MDSLFGLLITLLCMYTCYNLANQKGYNTFIALFCGFFFSGAAVVVYILLKDKHKEIE